MHSGTDDEPFRRLSARVESILERADDPGDDELLSAFGRGSDSGRGPDGPMATLARIGHIPHVVEPVLTVPTTSRLPGGSAAHSAVVRATRRESQALLEQTRRLAQEVSACLLEVLEEADAMHRGESLGDLARRVEAVAHAVSSLSGEVSRLSGQLNTAQARVEELEAAAPRRWFEPWYSSQDFDEEFRGTRDFLLLHYADLARLLASTGGPVLDLGCGRGELVQLLTSMDTEAWGVEVDPELVDFCRSIYLDVRLLDARAALESTDDASIGGIAMIQVVEHLSAQDLVDLVPLLLRKLRPGGLVVAETVNPGSPYVYTHSFYLDPTHSNPIHAAYLRFLFLRAGFSDVRIDWRSPVPDSERIPPVVSDASEPELVEQINAVFLLLNQVLFGPQDYALVATR